MAERANLNPLDRIVRVGRDLAGIIIPGARRAGRTVRQNLKVPAPPTSPPDLGELRDRAAQAGARATEVVSETARTAADAAATIGQALGDAVDQAASGSPEGTADAVSRAGSAVVAGVKDSVTSASQAATAAAGGRTAPRRRAAATTTREAATEEPAPTGAAPSTAASDAGPGSGVAYEEWTKAQLYERAQELDIDGRSTMNKGELIRALRDQG